MLHGFVAPDDARLAALLALLEGRRKITDDDWDLGRIIWDTSRAVRNAVADLGKQATHTLAQGLYSAIVQATTPR